MNNQTYRNPFYIDVIWLFKVRIKIGLEKITKPFLVAVEKISHYF